MVPEGGARAPFYMPWCDCAWFGGDHPDEASARREAAAHAEQVRPGLNAVGD